MAAMITHLLSRRHRRMITTLLAAAAALLVLQSPAVDAQQQEIVAIRGASIIDNGPLNHRRSHEPFRFSLGDRHVFLSWRR